MAISAFYNEELALVDAGKSFTYTTDGGYAENEFSIAGYTITAADEYGHAHGAYEAMHQLGFRYYTPFKAKYPATLPSGGVTVAQGAATPVCPFAQIFENYGRPAGYAVDETERWLILNNIDDTRKPNGHAWGTVMSRMEADTGYFTANPTHWTTAGTGPNGAYNLALTGSPRQQLVDAIALDLSVNLNEFDRAAFDCEDGDLYDTDTVITFMNEVVDALRLIVPAATLGLYAYAGHRAAPTMTCPNLYVQVALGFNDLGIGYPAMVQQWGAKAGAVGLRGYGDISAQDGYLPGAAGIRRESYLADYPGFMSDGAEQGRWETSHNHVLNIAGNYALIRMLKDGTTRLADIMADMVTDVFNSDAKVTEFYEYLASGTVRFSEFTLYDLCLIVNDMAGTSYKREFQDYMCFCINHWKMTPTGRSNGEFDPGWTDAQDNYYIPTLEENLRRSQYMGEAGYAAAYPYIRQLAASNIWNNPPNRDDLGYDADPHWMRHPQQPSVAEYDANVTLLAAAAFRPSELENIDLDNLVVVATEPTTACQNAGGGGDATALNYVTQGGSIFVYEGPGTVTVAYNTSTGGTVITAYGSGLHKFELESGADVTWDAGELFLLGFPGVRMDPDGTPTIQRNRWCYIPSSVIGDIKISNASRIRLHDSTGTTFDIKEATAPFSTNMVDPQGLSAGVAKVDNINTSDTSYLTNVCPFFSSTPYKMLMPKEFAELEFPAGSQLTLA